MIALKAFRDKQSPARHGHLAGDWNEKEQSCRWAIGAGLIPQRDRFGGLAEFVMGFFTEHFVIRWPEIQVRSHTGRVRHRNKAIQKIITIEICDNSFHKRSPS